LPLSQGVIARADFHLSYSYTQLLQLAEGDVSQARFGMHIAVSAGFGVHSQISKVVNGRIKKQRSAMLYASQ
jgi:hypothetical protein